MHPCGKVPVSPRVLPVANRVLDNLSSFAFDSLDTVSSFAFDSGSIMVVHDQSSVGNLFLFASTAAIIDFNSNGLMILIVNA